METAENFTPFEDFDNLTRIGAFISYRFDGVFEKNQRKTKSTYYLAKVLNTNMTILNLINESYNGIIEVNDSLDISSIYSLLRNQIETCNIYWYFIDDYSSQEEFNFKLLIYEYHDTVSSQIIYNTLFFTKENEEYFNNKETKQLAEINCNPYFELLNKNIKNQIIKGNKSTILTQFEIIQKRKLDQKKFKAFYKIFSTHTHSSPTAMKNLASSKINNISEDFEIMFMLISLHYISQFVANMILSVIELWELDDINIDDKIFLDNLSNQL